MLKEDLVRVAVYILSLAVAQVSSQYMEGSCGVINDLVLGLSDK